MRAGDPARSDFFAAKLVYPSFWNKRGMKNGRKKKQWHNQSGERHMQLVVREEFITLPGQQYSSHTQTLVWTKFITQQEDRNHRTTVGSRGGWEGWGIHHTSTIMEFIIRNLSRERNSSHATGRKNRIYLPPDACRATDRTARDVGRFCSCKLESCLLPRQRRCEHDKPEGSLPSQPESHSSVSERTKTIRLFPRKPCGLMLSSPLIPPTHPTQF